MDVHMRSACAIRARSLAVARVGEPIDFCRNTRPISQRRPNEFPDSVGTAYAIEKTRLEEAWDAKRGGRKGDAERGIGADQHKRLVGIGESSAGVESIRRP